MEYEHLLEGFKDLGAIFKKSFGGLSVYHEGLLVLVMMDSPEKNYKGKDYEYPIWQGLLIPTDHPHHEPLKSLFPRLRQHPFLKKWLHLPQEEDFETSAEEIIGYILRGPGLIGVEPKPRVRKSKKKKKNPFKGRKRS